MSLSDCSKCWETPCVCKSKSGESMMQSISSFAAFYRGAKKEREDILKYVEHALAKNFAKTKSSRDAQKILGRLRKLIMERN